MRADALRAELTRRRADDRLRAGRQREHRRVRPVRGRSSPPAARTARGATSTARSGSGPPPRPARAHLVAGAAGADSWARRRAQVAQRPVRLRARSRRRPGAADRGDVAHRRLPHRRPATASATAPTGRRRRPAAPARSRSTPRCASSAARGVAELVERHCALAARIAERLAARAGRRDPQRRRAQPGPRALRRRRRRPPTRSSRACRRTAPAGSAARAGTAPRAMRISVSGWQTTEADADRSADAIAAAWRTRRV